MDVRVKFMGAAKTVTGSKYLVEIDDFKLLVDCGLFQGVKELRNRNWDDFPMDVSDIDAIVLTHAHIDHIGYLPRLFRQGYDGPVYCNTCTEDLLQIMLLDSAKLQEEEAEWARKKKYTVHKSPEPLYTLEDAQSVFTRLKSFHYDEDISIDPKISIRLSNAGHIIGSSILEVFLQGDNQKKKLVFSGDLGRYSNPVLRDPEVIEEADVLFIESTYGNRENPSVDPKENIAEIVNEAMDNRGCVIIPAFALGRTQSIIYYLRELFEEGKIPDVPVYIDSPMAISVTRLYKKHFSYHKLGDAQLKTGQSVFDYKNLKYCKSPDQSKAVNDIKSRAIIVSASGMCTGGRILHHLYHRLPRKNDTILFVGYQAYGTRGRDILEKDPDTKIFGIPVKVNCNVRKINGLSAHADRSELLQWLGNFKTSPKMTFVTHGEEEVASEFAQEIRNEHGWNATVPDYLESFELFKGI